MRLLLCAAVRYAPVSQDAGIIRFLYVVRKAAIIRKNLMILRERRRWHNALEQKRKKEYGGLSDQIFHSDAADCYDSGTRGRDSVALLVFE